MNLVQFLVSRYFFWYFQVSHSNFSNNTGIQYKISWKNIIKENFIKDEDFQNTVQKSRKYHLEWKMKNTKYNRILLKNDLKYKHINVGYIMVVISNCIRYALLGI